MSNNKHEVAVRNTVRIEMERKLTGLRAKEKELTRKLENHFDNDTFRALNMIGHKIEVSELRKVGGWLTGDYPMVYEIKAKR